MGSMFDFNTRSVWWEFNMMTYANVNKTAMIHFVGKFDSLDLELEFPGAARRAISFLLS